MKQETIEFKDVMSFNEMAAACKAEYPYYIPNGQRVGRYAKTKGYVVRRQTINKKQTYFYVKAEIAK